MSKILLIHTLGNRDWQFDTKIAYQFAKKYLESNTENKLFLVPIKKNDDTCFLEVTQTLSEILKHNLEYAKEMKEYQQFPMLVGACEFIFKEKEVAEIDKVWIIATAQHKPHNFDTKFVAPIAAQYLKEYYQTFEGAKIKETEVSNLLDNIHDLNTEEKLYLFFYEQLKKAIDEGFDRIYLSCNTGLPKVTNVIQNLFYWDTRFTYLNHFVKNNETITQEMYRMSKDLRIWEQQ